MLTTLALIKMGANGLALAAAIITFISAENQRQFELARDMGTVASRIEDAKLLGQKHDHLQKQYDALVNLKGSSL